MKFSSLTQAQGNAFDTHTNTHTHYAHTPRHTHTVRASAARLIVFWRMPRSIREPRLLSEPCNKSTLISCLPACLLAPPPCHCLGPTPAAATATRHVNCLAKYLLNTRTSCQFQFFVFRFSFPFCFLFFCRPLCNCFVCEGSLSRSDRGGTMTWRSTGKCLWLA